MIVCIFEHVQWRWGEHLEAKQGRAVVAARDCLPQPAHVLREEPAAPAHGHLG